jgi:hypothetical protein
VLSVSHAGQPTIHARHMMHHMIARLARCRYCACVPPLGSNLCSGQPYSRRQCANMVKSRQTSTQTPLCSMTPKWGPLLLLWHALRVSAIPGRSDNRTVMWLDNKSSARARSTTRQLAHPLPINTSRTHTENASATALPVSLTFIPIMTFIGAHQLAEKLRFYLVRLGRSVAE